jgi:hypothetical protein
MIQDAVHKFVLSSLLENEIELPWDFSFRGSSIPICPRQLMLGTFHKKTHKKISFSSRYSFHMRQAINALAQEFWADSLWGDWRCSDINACGVKYKNNRLPNGKCIRCGSPAFYEKIIKDERTGFSGHCDAIVYSDELDGYLVFEIRTRNPNVISRTLEPYPSEIYQVSAFATLLQRQHWLRIAGRAILWVGNSVASKSFKLWTYPGTGEELADQQFQLKLDLDQKIKEGRIFDVEGRCNSPEDTNGCPFAGICLSPVRDRLLETDYKEWLLGNSH